MQQTDLVTVSLILGGVSSVIGLLAHCHFRSKCCGKEVSIDTDSGPKTPSPTLNQSFLRRNPKPPTQTESPV